MNDANKAIRKARSAVIQGHPFFGALLLKQKLVECEVLPDGSTNHTMATDGKHVYYNPGYVLGSRPEHTQFVVAHEALHPAFDHQLRRGERDPKLWNAACDYAINPILVEAGLHAPDGALLRNDLKGMSAEDIYKVLDGEQQAQDKPQEAGDGDQGQDSGDGQKAGDGDQGAPGDDSGEQDGDNVTEIPGAVLDSPADSEQERAEESREWKVAMTQAVNFAAAGSLPGGLREMIDGHLAPRVRWDEALDEFIQEIAQQDYSWQKANRRFVGHGLYLPSLDSKQMGPMAQVIDASASMPIEALNQVLAEQQQILDTYQPEFLDVIVHDTLVTNVFRFEPGDEIELDIKARGGTAFAPVCEHLNECGEDYAVVVWFTDLQTWDWGKCEPINAPLVWLDFCGRQEPPFGDRHLVMKDF